MLKRTALLAVLLVPTLAFAASSGEGHQVVGFIARTRLTAEAKAGIIDLLEPRMNISDPDVSSWADHQKHSETTGASYHFIHADVGEATIDLANDGRDGKNVVAGIDKYAAILANPSAKVKDRQEALRWVINLVGDLHQPLHCCDRAGGVGKEVAVMFQLKKTPINLFSVWNSELLNAYIGRGSIQEYANDLATKISNADAQTWSNGSTLDWANESHALGVKIYAALPAPEPAEPPAVPAISLDAGYVRNEQVTVNTQLQKAGVRLAVVLNRAFAQAATQPTSRPSKASK